jgi:photosystem II stability/assembly factor-like uncharacterized protein
VLYAFKGSTVYKTTNGGDAWTNVSSGLSGTPISGAVSATNPNDVWVAVSGYTASSKVFHSTNGGSTWTNETSSGLPNIPANAIALDNLGQNGVYVGMDAGVFYKKNGLGSWQNFSDGLPNAIVKEMEIAQKGTNANDRRLVIATFGRGIWRSTLWDDNPTPVRSAKLPALRNLKTSISGSTLQLSFQLGTDRFDEGNSTLRLTTVAGKVIHQETVPNFGLIERRLNLSGYGKGVLLLVLENQSSRVSRRLAFH